MTEANMDSSAPWAMTPRQSVAQADGQSVFGVVDVGGTKIVAGVASATGILRTERLSTHALRGPDDIVDRIARALTGLCTPGLSPMSAVGLSVPGPLDRRSGVVHFTPNLLWQRYPVADRLSQRLGGIPVLIDDDANCAALGEAWEAGRDGCVELVCLNISAGIGRDRAHGERAGRPAGRLRAQRGHGSRRFVRGDRRRRRGPAHPARIPGAS